jgi:hypothetical protein
MGTITFNPQGGAIYIRVMSGPPCIGTFSLWYYNKIIGNVTQLYPDSLNLIHDNIPDNLVLPLDVETIQNITLRVIGRYGPLPNHTQVAVRYQFHQDGQLLNIAPKNYNVIQENHNTPPPYKQYNHDFNFKAL